MSTNEKELILNIVKRLGRKIWYEDNEMIEFEINTTENIVIEFDKNGCVVEMY